MSLLRLFLVVLSAILVIPSVNAEPPTGSPLAAAPERIDINFELADGPAWDGNSLLVPDVKAEQVSRWLPGKKQLQEVGALSGRISGSYFQLGQFYLSRNPECRIDVWEMGGKPKTLAQFPDGHRPNDLVVDRSGNVFVTLTKQNKVVRIDSDGGIHDLDFDVKTPNGITLSPDESVLYVSEFKPRRVIAVQLTRNDSTLAAGPSAEFAIMNQDASLKGGGDGMAMDRAGNVYCAGADGVYIWNSAGELRQKVEYPSRPINCLLGGKRDQTLYATCFDGLYQSQINSYARPPQSVLGDDELGDDELGDDQLRIERDVIFARPGGRALMADIYRPAGDQALPGVLLVHGGGWLHGDKSRTRSMALKLARCGHVVMSVEYRLGHEAPFPAGVQDVAVAVRYLRANAKQFGVDPAKIAAVGGSAGGHLVGLVGNSYDNPSLNGQTWVAPELEDISSQLQAVVVMAGPMETLTGSVAELSLATPPVSNAEHWLRGTIGDKRELYAMADVLTKIGENSPPMLFQCGDQDNPERNAATRKKLTSFGVSSELKVYADGKHGCWNRDPWQQQFVVDTDVFLSKVFSGTP